MNVATAEVLSFQERYIRSSPGLTDPFRINTYDIDGVIWLPQPYQGLKPDIHDIIITGRSIDEAPETFEFLESRQIFNEVYFNPIPFNCKTRESSAYHKAGVIRALLQEGYKVGIHFEDDPLQAEIIRYRVPEIVVVEIRHNLVELENVRRPNVH